MGGIVFGPHRRERIAFASFGAAGLGRIKLGLGHNEILHLYKKCAKLVRRNCDWTVQAPADCLSGGDREPVGNGREPAGNHVKSEGKVYLRDKTYD